MTRRCGKMEFCSTTETNTSPPSLVAKALHRTRPIRNPNHDSAGEIGAVGGDESKWRNK